MAKLALLTSGGDAPGMNMALWAATQAARERGWEVLGVREGFAGLLRGDFLELDPVQTLPYARLGGTFLGTSRDPDFQAKLPQALQALNRAGVTHLMVLGGNGSLQGAQALARRGVNVVGLPATIDNDVAGSEESIGFDTALNFGLLLLDQFRDTAEALPRLCALETLGGDTGFLARAVGQAGGADAILVPEEPLPPEKILESTQAAIARQRFALIVASEGYPDLEITLETLSKEVGLRLRFARPSHAMRGGRPSARDRLLARELAETGVERLAQGHSGAVLVQQGRPALVVFDQLEPRKAP
ncbi:MULTISPECIES: 6-phosphofructokinase [unclassified Meiothermus]|uniref:6-phosphofructokinase n=1 Tax=unclassified Meiothermus TaxID=370471 RepID=UPI000D7C6D56|nr:MULTISPECIES: 6-phosphofructokinase [unclassified Meiothermus]PZA06013.1 phosphofructokinase [Meiothermus sp. Pnk-1]RYM35239.1 phosphofructokinase [Meiothermus sp. PNK-Is4]